MTLNSNWMLLLILAALFFGWQVNPMATIFGYCVFAVWDMYNIIPQLKEDLPPVHDEAWMWVSLILLVLAPVIQLPLRIFGFLARIFNWSID